MRRILILCAKSWGQAGNLNSALRLASQLRPHLPHAAEIFVQSAEDWLPLVAEIGMQMRDLAVASGDAAEREERYMTCISAVERRFPAGFELDRQFNGDGGAIAMLAERIEALDPDIVIGTKGFLTRLVHAAQVRFGVPVSIANYVTNDGLLSLALHKTDAAILNLVQTDFGHRAIGHFGRTLQVGPLVARTPPRVREPDRDQRPLVAILCNRNPEYRELFDRLLKRGSTIRVNAVIMGCPALLDHVRSVAPPHWQVWDAQAASIYLELLADVAAAPPAVLVTKSAPGSLFEAVAAGIPVLTVRSGLPMENWTLDLVREAGMGWPAGEISTAITRLEELIDDPAEIEIAANAARTFASRTIDNARTLSLICQAMTVETAARRRTGENLHDDPVRLRPAL